MREGDDLRWVRVDHPNLVALVRPSGGYARQEWVEQACFDAGSNLQHCRPRPRLDCDPPAFDEHAILGLCVPEDHPVLEGVVDGHVCSPAWWTVGPGQRRSLLCPVRQGKEICRYFDVSISGHLDTVPCVRRGYAERRSFRATTDTKGRKRGEGRLWRSLRADPRKGTVKVQLQRWLILEWWGRGTLPWSSISRLIGGMMVSLAVLQPSCCSARRDGG